MHSQQSHATSLESVYRPVLSAISRAVQRVRHNADALNGTDELISLLETLPLSSDEFGLATVRLRNAERYLESSETGAAIWEFTTLQNQLRALAQAKTREPRRRRRS